MAKEDIINIQLGLIQVKKSAVEAMKSSTGKEDVYPLLASYCARFINGLGEGGMFVDGKHIAAIEDATKKTVNNPSDLVRLCQDAQGRPEGKFTVTASLDPAYEEAINQTAAWRGITPDEVMQEMANQIVANGWLENWTGPMGVLPLSGVLHAQLQAITGKAVYTSADVEKALASVKG